MSDSLRCKNIMNNGRKLQRVINVGLNHVGVGYVPYHYMVYRFYNIIILFKEFIVFFVVFTVFFL